jgi:hypothetical protein
MHSARNAFLDIRGIAVQNMKSPTRDNDRGRTTETQQTTQQNTNRWRAGQSHPLPPRNGSYILGVDNPMRSFWLLSDITNDPKVSDCALVNHAPKAGYSFQLGAPRQKLHRVPIHWDVCPRKPVFDQPNVHGYFSRPIPCCLKVLGVLDSCAGFRSTTINPAYSIPSKTHEIIPRFARLSGWLKMRSINLSMCRF